MWTSNASSGAFAARVQTEVRVPGPCRAFEKHAHHLRGRHPRVGVGERCSVEADRGENRRWIVAEGPQAGDHRQEATYSER